MKNIRRKNINNIYIISIKLIYYNFRYVYIVLVFIYLINYNKYNLYKLNYLNYLIL